VSGRISVLVSKELLTLLQAVRVMPKEMTAEIRKHTRTVAEPVWREAVRGNVTTRLETRVLSDTARVSVSDSNVMLKSATVGKVAPGTEFGADPSATITTRSRNGKVYKRRRGTQFKPPRRRGYVVWSASSDVIPRIASLWVQTAIRTMHEVLEKGGVR
jgi:hypothetical protein